MPSDLVAVSVVAVSGAIGTATDLKARRAPNAVTFGIAAGGIALAATHVTNISVAGAVGGLAVGLLLMLPGHIAGATGAGDVKLFAAVGTLIGPTRMLTAFAYTAIIGAVLAIGVAVRRRRLRHALQGTAALITTAGANAAEIENPSANNRFAYAPAIALGTLATALGF